jgi:hypothetical protein
MEMFHIIIVLLGGLLVVAAIAWLVKLMLKPVVIFTVVAVMGWLAWYSGLGYTDEGPNAAIAQQQVERSLETE